MRQAGSGNLHGRGCWYLGPAVRGRPPCGGCSGRGGAIRLVRRGLRGGIPGAPHAAARSRHGGRAKKARGGSIMPKGGAPPPGTAAGEPRGLRARQSGGRGARKRPHHSGCPKRGSGGGGAPHTHGRHGRATAGPGAYRTRPPRGGIRRRRLSWCGAADPHSTGARPRVRSAAHVHGVRDGTGQAGDRQSPKAAGIAGYANPCGAGTAIAAAPAGTGCPRGGRGRPQGPA